MSGSDRPRAPRSRTVPRRRLEGPQRDLYLAIDSGSPLVSVALGRRGGASVQRAIDIQGSSEALLGLIDELLSEVGVGIAEISGILALRGPGSFTGLRVGLATALGLHLATGVPAAAIATLDVLAFQGVSRAAAEPLIAAVDAQRGEWAMGVYDARVSPPRGSPMRTADEREIVALSPGCLIGFGTTRLAARIAGQTLEPKPLAATALEVLAATEIRWDEASLRRPIYSRPPAATRSCAP